MTDPLAVPESNDPRARTQSFQEDFYTHDVDYTLGSPHLSHPPLRERLSGLLRAAIKETERAGLPLRVLEVGAGHGGYTEIALALGCEVTAVEMSAPSLEILLNRYGMNSRLTGIYDPDGALHSVGDGFSLVLAVSVLHHIPDYLEFLRTVSQRLAPGGGLLSLQDPLWYPRMPRLPHVADRLAYLAWRSRLGNLRTGWSSLSRRMLGSLDEGKPGDMVEYHVVRNGVDEEAIERELAMLFADVDVIKYWSNQAATGQRLGDRFGWTNTLGVSAFGYRATTPRGS